MSLLLCLKIHTAYIVPQNNAIINAVLELHLLTLKSEYLSIL